MDLILWGGDSAGVAKRHHLESESMMRLREPKKLRSPQAEYALLNEDAVSHLPDFLCCIQCPASYSTFRMDDVRVTLSSRTPTHPQIGVFPYA